MAFYITYAGHTNEEYGLMAYRRPDYSASEEIIDTFEIPGRETDLYRRSGRYQPNEIPVTFNYAVEDRNQWGRIWRKALCWLRLDGNYSQSDDEDVFRKVRNVVIGTDERTSKRIGKFDATFVCKPGEYFVDGAEFYEIGSISQSSHDGWHLNNDYSECRPRYRLTGNGVCSLVVNGNTMDIAMDTDMIIDTDRKIAYRVTGGESCNTGVSGDYDGLVLVPGENVIQCNGSGVYTWEIEPNWRVI